MVAKPDERTLKMMENYMTLRRKGLSNHEIAQEFNLSDWTVYNRLGQIAEKEGVTREELLDKPIYVRYVTNRNFTPVKPISREKFNDSFTLLLNEVDSICAEISKTIEDIKTMNAILEEEMK